jgi:hypothetical protein
MIRTEHKYTVLAERKIFILLLNVLVHVINTWLYRDHYLEYFEKSNYVEHVLFHTGVPFLMFPCTTAHRIESLHSPRHSATPAVLWDTIKGVFPISLALFVTVVT